LANHSGLLLSHRDYIETLTSNPPSALPDVNLKNTNQKNHYPQLGLLHTTINLVILNLSRSNVLKTPPPTQRAAGPLSHTPPGPSGVPLRSSLPPLRTSSIPPDSTLHVRITHFSPPLQIAMEERGLILHTTLVFEKTNFGGTLIRNSLWSDFGPGLCLRTRTTHNEDSASHLIDFVPRSHCPTCNTKPKSFTCNCCGDEVGKNSMDKNEFLSAKAPHPSHSNSIQIRAHQIPYPRTIMTATSLSSKTYSKITKGHRIFLLLFLRQLKRRVILEPASRNSRDTQNCRRHRNLQGRGQCKHPRPVSHKNSTGQSDRTLPRMLTTIPRRGQLHRAFETTCGTREIPRLLFRLEHYYFIFQVSQVTENPKNFRTRHIYDSNLVHLAPPKHGTSILNG
jgi:hypothetical protein